MNRPGISPAGFFLPVHNLGCLAAAAALRVMYKASGPAAVRLWDGPNNQSPFLFLNHDFNTYLKAQVMQPFTLQPDKRPPIIAPRSQIGIIYRQDTRPVAAIIGHIYSP